MLFNSIPFIFIFLPIVFAVYFTLTQNALNYLAKYWLIAASLFFYSWWNVYFLPILVTSVLVNYATTRKIQSLQKHENNIGKRKKYFVFGLCFNLFLLGYFKYRDFFIDTTNHIFATDFVLLHLALPLGISFFTLQQIAFLVDAYEDLAEEPNFIDYSIFVTFFPQLIAGPIVHHQEMMPQFASAQNQTINYKNIAKGISIFAVGLFKKLVIADTFSVWATTGFDDAVVLTFVEAWATSASFSFQLYFDFSGYSDMAVGLGLLFNINLINNFNSPYKATSIINFWARWHITLTRFITTYIYTPIIRSFGSINFSNSMLATFLAMMIAGLWHGPAWTFVIFGGMHGLALVINHIWKKNKFPCAKLLGWFFTMNFVNVSFVVFRAKEWEDAIKVLKGMLGLNGVVISNSLLKLLPNLSDYGFLVGKHLKNLQANDDVLRMIIVSIVVVIFFKNSNNFVNTLKMNWPTLIFVSLISIISILSLTKISPFLYFNF